MKSNLTQLDNIFQILQSITLHDPSANATSADDHYLNDVSPRALHYVYDSEKASKLKADMEYISKELEQTRRGIKEARAQVRRFVKLRVFRPS